MAGTHMPAVAIEGRFRFVVNTRENSFEPPHVHVWVGNEDVCCIELNGGTFMETPPPGNIRDIMQAYARYAEDIRKTSPPASAEATSVIILDRMMMAASVQDTIHGV